MGHCYLSIIETAEMRVAVTPRTTVVGRLLISAFLFMGD